MSTDIVKLATRHAAMRHAYQLRKYTHEPYIVHCYEVVNTLKTLAPENLTDEMLAAAWLHDTVEDTGESISNIKALFGETVATYVDWLTDKSKPSDGVRAVRKAIDREHLAKAPPEVQTIKLADLISNFKSIKANDARFFSIYYNEAKLLHNVLTKGDRTLHTCLGNMLMVGAA